MEYIYLQLLGNNVHFILTNGGEVVLKVHEVTTYEIKGYNLEMFYTSIPRRLIKDYRILKN